MYGVLGSWALKRVGARRIPALPFLFLPLFTEARGTRIFGHTTYLLLISWVHMYEFVM